MEDKMSLLIDAVSNMQDSISNMQKDINNMQTDISNMHGEINSMHGEINSMHGEINEMHGEIDDTKQNLTTLTNIVTNMEYEHGLKLSALYDYIDVNRSEHEALMKMFKSHDKKWYNHEIKIQELEKVVSDKF